MNVSKFKIFVSILFLSFFIGCKEGNLPISPVEANPVPPFIPVPILTDEQVDLQKKLCESVADAEYDNETHECLCGVERIKVEGIRFREICAVKVLELKLAKDLKEINTKKCNGMHKNVIEETCECAKNVLVSLYDPDFEVNCKAAERNELENVCKNAKGVVEGNSCKCAPFPQMPLPLNTPDLKIRCEEQQVLAQSTCISGGGYDKACRVENTCISASNGYECRNERSGEGNSYEGIWTSMRDCCASISRDVMCFGLQQGKSCRWNIVKNPDECIKMGGRLTSGKRCPRVRKLQEAPAVQGPQREVAPMPTEVVEPAPMEAPVDGPVQGPRIDSKLDNSSILPNLEDLIYISR